MTHSESPEDQFDLNDPQWFAAEASKAATARARARLTEFEKLELVDAEADIRLKQAQVDKAQARAEAEPARQRMSLKERETRRWITIGLAVFTPLYLTATLLLAPWVIPSTGIATGITATFAYLWRRAGLSA